MATFYTPAQSNITHVDGIKTVMEIVLPTVKEFSEKPVENLSTQGKRNNAQDPVLHKL